MFRGRSAAFTSPKYPNNYDDDVYCEWFLEVEENHRLSLNFVDFSLESSSNCIHDSVKVIFIFDMKKKKANEKSIFICLRRCFSVDLLRV